MTDFPADIYTEPAADPDTLANLGPLTRMAGLWKGTRGLDTHPKAPGPKKQAYVETIELQPIDPQTNGPQLFYGLRYHQHITKPDRLKTFHDQVGYWLWEPATGRVIQTLCIPRAQTAMAFGQASADATTFELVATRESLTNGISSDPFIEYAFRTVEYRIKVTLNPDGTWSYEQDSVLVIPGLAEPFHHTDKSVLTKTGEATPNPLTRETLPPRGPG